MEILFIALGVIYLFIAGIVYSKSEGEYSIYIGIFWIIVWPFKLGEYIATKWYVYKSLK
jgi:hypothetical protein